MEKKYFFGTASILVLIFCIYYLTFTKQKAYSMNYSLTEPHSMIPELFPKNPQDINDLVHWIKKQTTAEINNILAIPDNQRTFDNTVRRLDQAKAFNFSVPSSSIAVLAYVSNDEQIRNTAHQALISLEEYAIDTFEQNIDLYNAVKSYADTLVDDSSSLTQEQDYALRKILHNGQRNGLHLPEQQRTRIKKLKKELATLAVEFERNISTDQRSITATLEELQGLDADFIAQLKRTDNGLYILGTDYPTYFMVMQHADNQSVRKNLFRQFSNRAHPTNYELLQKIIAKRHDLATLLGFSSYAHYNIDTEMAESPERVITFLNSLIKKAAYKEKQEIEQLLQDLPPSITIAANKKINPWDKDYINAYYKKKHFDIDNREIANYFPMEHTVKALLSIYTSFFAIEFDQLPIQGLWDEQVRLIQVRTTDNTILGYLLLDLFPRPNKFTHACQMTVIPALKENATMKPSLAVVLANFPKPSDDKPSLLPLEDVRTFFHEFGHALHAILGSTELASCSGTNVKTDFVEMPSQMLEQWLWDPEILRKTSSHYKTGQSLPDQLIEKIIALKHFSTGSWLTRQLYFSSLSLYSFMPNNIESIDTMSKKLYERIRMHDLFDSEDHHTASFGHLMGYGAGYYGYLWALVFAHDLFAHIKKEGLLNPVIGTKYKEKILSKGGSDDPENLLESFLGRKPNERAFLKNMGFIN